MGILSKWAESLDYEYQILTSCTRYQSPRSTCEKCLLVCEREAISLENGLPFIHKDRCVECGNCISICPVQAVAGIFPKRVVMGNRLIVTNGYKPTVRELLVLYRKGITSIVSEESALLEYWKKPIEEAKMKLQQLGEEPFSVTVQDSLNEEESYSRRELFSFLNKETKSLVKQMAPANWRFNQEDLNVEKYYNDYQFANITIDFEKCTLCKACQKLCKKNCFDITENSLIISPQSCSACQLCADICPEHAILVEELISPATNITNRIYEKKCKSCGETYQTLRENDENCVMCTKQASFFTLHGIESSFKPD